MKDEIENYEPREPSVESVGEHRVVAWVGDSKPSAGQTLWIGNLAARIERRLPERCVEAILFDRTGVSPGDPVSVSDDTASFPAPRRGMSALEDLAFEPGEETHRAESAEADGRLSTGITALDEACPLVAGGVNVIIDAGADPTIFDRLVRAVETDDLVAATPRVPDFNFTHGITWDSHVSIALGLRVATNWLSRLSGAALVVEAPPLDLDELTAGLDGRTVIAHFVVSEGLEVIAETLDIGTADCQIFLRPDGTLDFGRSHSRLGSDTAWPELAARANELRDKVSLFGLEELDDEERELLERMRDVERALTNE